MDQISACTYMYQKQHIKLLLSERSPNRQIELRTTSIMLSQIGLIHLFCSLYFVKVANGYLYMIYFTYSSLTYQGHTNKQLASLSDSFVTHWLEFFKKSHSYRNVKISSTLQGNM